MAPDLIFWLRPKRSQFSEPEGLSVGSPFGRGEFSEPIVSIAVLKKVRIGLTRAIKTQTSKHRPKSNNPSVTYGGQALYFTRNI
jgi:hypothetical protein